MMVQKFGFESIKTNSTLQNSLYTISGIVATFVAISISYVFSKYPEIISTLWLFESTLIFYFFSQKRDWKLYVAGLILFIIGVFKFSSLINVVGVGDYTILVSLAMVLVSLVLNIKFISPQCTSKVEGYDVWHSIFHIFYIIMFVALIVDILPYSNYGWAVFVISGFVALLGAIYGYLSSRVLKHVFVIGFALVCLGQILDFNTIMRRIDKNDLEHLRVLQYLASGFMVLAYIAYSKYNTLKKTSSQLLVVLWLYLFIITTMYVDDIFNNSFAITIYWGILAFILLMRGIGHNSIKLRTLGLYIVTLTAGKIFLYDIWYGLSSGIARVIALIFVGVLLIVISTRYTQKYGNNLKGEFKFGNIFGQEVEPQTVNESIKNIDAGEYKGVRFVGNDDSKTQVRSENLLKIAIMIINKYNKSNFEAGELQQTYDNVLQNYTSQLSPSQLQRVTTVVKNFVEVGGSVELIKK